MYARVLAGRPHRLDRLRQEWPALRVDAGAAVAGLTPAGGWVGVLRFEGPPTPPDPALAAAVEGCFEGAPTNFDSADIQLVLAGSPAPGAGFVQVMQARVADRAGWTLADADAVPRFAAARPDFLGSLRIWHDGLLTVVDSFSSEAAARAGEASAPSPEDQAAYLRWFSFLAEVAWHDLLDPW